MVKKYKDMAEQAGVPNTATDDTVAQQDAASNAVHEGNGDKAPKESKASRFVRLASRRVAKAIKALQTVRALANRAQYEYTEGQRSRVLTALANELTRVADAFHKTEKTATATFDVGE